MLFSSIVGPALASVIQTELEMRKQSKLDADTETRIAKVLGSRLAEPVWIRYAKCSDEALRYSA